MKNLTGTETDKNLRNAFSGESEAAMKYSFYAYAARQEGYQQIADIFDESASNEREHAEIWSRNSTVSAIRETISSPLPQVNDMNGAICTPALPETAKKRGFCRSCAEV